MRRATSALLLASVSCLLAMSADLPDKWRAWRYSRPIEGQPSQRDGAAQLSLPWEIYAHCQAGCEDARIVTSQGYNLKLWIRDNTNLNQIDITPDGLYLDLIAIPAPDRYFPANIGNDFHTYHIEGEGQHLLVQMDDQIAFDLIRTNHPAGTRGLIFGDMWAINPYYPNVSEWDYFRVTVPEPAIMPAMLLLACTSLTHANSRRRIQQPTC